MYGLSRNERIELTAAKADPGDRRYGQTRLKRDADHDAALRPDLKARGYAPHVLKPACRRFANLRRHAEPRHDALLLHIKHLHEVRLRGHYRQGGECPADPGSEAE
ncbi:hypothetical protein D3C73_1348260 [compost metagenome]